MSSETNALQTKIQPHSASADEVLRTSEVDPKRGLTDEDAVQRRERYGANELAQAPGTPLWKRLANQFRALVIWILIAAAILSGVLGEWADAIAIIAIVLLNGVIGFLQEEKAARSLAALRQLSAPLAKIMRDGKLRSLPAREIVPGDIVSVEAGDFVPADARLIETFGLRVQESALTGESLPVDKDAGARLAERTGLADRHTMIYMGTLVAAGKAAAVVTATGMQTELGQIAGMLAADEPEPTPLERRLEELGKVLIVVCLVLVGVVFGLNLLRGHPVLEVLLLSVSLAVAAVPEGLPAVVTLALALGLQRMVKRNALVRKLPSVETLGSVTVICSDKTGTLTRNEMTVRELLAGDSRYALSGIGYQIAGDVQIAAENAKKGLRAEDDPDLAQALLVGVRCNSARLSNDGDGVHWKVVGDPTEAALLVAAAKAGVQPGAMPAETIDEIPFDSERKAMSVVAREPDGRVVMYTKGAPEVVVAKCSSYQRAGNSQPLGSQRRAFYEERTADMAGRALRVLALAFRPYEDGGAQYREEDLTLAGLAGMIDPAREEAKTAVARCKQAGVRAVMITGDHPATAIAIARELGIAAEADEAMTGEQLDDLGVGGLAERVERIAVYARVSAQHKQQIVQAWKAKGHVVAMTGDGVNDAPAVKAADIGIAMGIAGTDVTKEASDMVLTDDNFASIVNAVEEGRGIFANIQKFVHFLLSSNASEVLFMFIAALVGWPAPLLPIQLLWINLVTDSLPALALAMEKPEPDIMRQPPRAPGQPVITPKDGAMMVTYGMVMAICMAVAFAVTFDKDDKNSLPVAQTVAFSVAAYSQLFFAFGCRSQRYTLPELGLFTNPYLFGAIAISGLLQAAVLTLPFAQKIFDTVTPSASQWLLIMGLAIVPVTVIEVSKLLMAARRKRRRSQPSPVGSSAASAAK